MADELQKPAAAAPQAIHHELRTAENSAAYLLPKLYSMREASQHLKILDVGAGSGTISTTFAKAIPKGTVTAVDLNPDILQRAGAVAESAGVSNITFQQADACSLPFEDETFDITHCHQVLTHLKEPWVALGEMIRVTKPGGIVAAREGDAETQVIWPELPGLIQFNKLVGWAISAGGGSSAAGRRLLSWALRAGAQRSRITASYSAWGYSEPAEKQVWGTSLSHSLAHTPDPVRFPSWADPSRY